jgi:tetratricopeptide (TPR) repeat protein
MQRLARLIVITLCILTPAASSFAQPQSKLSPEEAAKWRADAKFLAEQLPRTHKNAFHSISQEKFSAAVADLDRHIPSMQRHEVVVGIFKLVAMVGDGHTHINPFQPAVQFRTYPIKLYAFSDGIFVQSADPKYAALVGGKLLRIGNASADEAYAKISDIVFKDNDMAVKSFAPVLMTIPEVLHAHAVISDMESAPIVVEKDGHQIKATLSPAAIPHQQFQIWPRVDGWADMRSSGTPPLWLRNTEDFFWYEYLPDSRTLYVQYNAVANKPNETVAAFFDRVFKFADANPVDRMVLDLRLNGGGNNALNMPIIHGLIRSDKLNQRGKLFVVLGRQTFSAAQNCVNELEIHTNAIFVGEPTAANPNHYGDAAPIQLPNSGIRLQASTLWWQDVDPRDTRPWTPPYLNVELSSADYRNNVDPVLAMVMKYTNEPTIVEKVRTMIAANDFAAAHAVMKAFRADPVYKYANAERDINLLGYTLLGSNKLIQALEVFKINTEAYPESFNVWDSLGEAYLKHGDLELAASNYEKSLSLNSRNPNARDVIARIRGAKPSK